jgi:hypothetical protein
VNGEVQRWKKPSSFAGDAVEENGGEILWYSITLECLIGQGRIAAEDLPFANYKMTCSEGAGAITRPIPAE